MGRDSPKPNLTQPFWQYFFNFNFFQPTHSILKKLPTSPLYIFLIANLFFKSFLEEPLLKHLRARFCMRSNFSTIVNRDINNSEVMSSDSDSWTPVIGKGRRSHNPTTSGSKSVKMGQGQLPAGSVLMNSVTTKPTVRGRPGSIVKDNTCSQQPTDRGRPVSIVKDNTCPVQPTGRTRPVSIEQVKPCLTNSTSYDEMFPPLPTKRGGWGVTGGLAGGQPVPRNLFGKSKGLDKEGILDELDRSPSKDSTPSPPPPVPAAPTSAAPTTGPPPPVPAAPTSAAPTTGPPSPSATVCIHCLEATQHKCMQCGQIRCVQYHMKQLNEKNRFICKGCDPTVIGILGLSTMWRMPGLTSPGTQPPSKRRKTGSSPPPPPTGDPAGSAGPSRSDR